MGFREVIGEEDIDGVPHYLVSVTDTKHSLGHATELVAKFETRLARS